MTSATERRRQVGLMGNGGLLNSQVGEYRLVDFLGAGGMGEVYRAVHLKIGRVVAVKVLTRAEKQPSLVERFLNEARIQASLQHPNIATLYDLQEVQGNPCIIMEYVDGQNLDERIRYSAGMPLSEAVFIFQAVVEALSYMHGNGIIHRDIKTNNIKINLAGQVKLLDFGIAKAGATPSLTVTGDVVGTLQYLSPEQLKGGTADTRSDVWALGILLYELVTGHVPFEANTVGVLYEKITKAEYAAPRYYNPAVPQEVEGIIARCLKKQPGDRYQTAMALRTDAMNLLRVVSTPRLSSASLQTEALGRKGMSGGAIFAIAAVAIVVVLLSVVVGVWFLGQPPSPDPVSPRPAVSPGGPYIQANQTPAVNPGGGNIPSDSAGVETVNIDVAEGHALVYINDKPVGPTPLAYQAKVGERLDVVLRQRGYKDKVVPPITVDT
ncbi:MAG TPA: serine/threonine-protein kinase, partial [Blastocatellia bacterium]